MNNLRYIRVVVAMLCGAPVARYGFLDMVNPGNESG